MLDSCPWNEDASQDVFDVNRSNADYLQQLHEDSQKQHLRSRAVCFSSNSRPRIIIAEECDDDDELLLILTEASSPSDSSLSSYMDNLASSAGTSKEHDLDVSITGPGTTGTNPQEHSPILTSSVQTSITIGNPQSNPTTIAADDDEEGIVDMNIENENVFKNDCSLHNSNFDLAATYHERKSSSSSNHNFGLSNSTRSNIVMSSSPSSFSTTSTTSSSSSGLKYQYIPRHSSSPSY